MSAFIQILYIDPGSGSLLFQMILSGLLTILVFFKRLVQFFRALFIGKNLRLLFSKKERKQ